MLIRMSLTLFLILCFPALALAGGFQILEHGAVSTAMANARTAIADDISALYFNPAAMSELGGFQFEIGVTGILPIIDYEPAGNPVPPRQYPSYENGEYVFKEVNDGTNAVGAKEKLFTPIHLYASYNLQDLGLSFGYGLNNPFGLGTFWPGDWDGRFIATETQIQTFFNQATVALDVAKLAGFKDSLKLSIAIAYDVVYATALLGKKVDLRAAEAPSLGTIMDPEAEMSMRGTAWGQGFNAALYAELPGLLAAGVSFRSGVHLPFSGKADFSFNQSAREASDLLHIVIPDETDGSVDMDLPATVNFGLAFLGVSNLVVAADVYLAAFSSYDEIELKFDCVSKGTCSDSLNAGPIEKNWGTSVQVSLGVQYTLLDALGLRAGYGHITSPVPEGTYDPSLPDGERNIFSVGLGWRASWWKIDLGYMLAMWSGVKDNDVGAGDNNNPEGKANGTYRTTTHILALSLSANY